MGIYNALFSRIFAPNQESYVLIGAPRMVFVQGEYVTVWKVIMDKIVQFQYVPQGSFMIMMLVLVLVFALLEHIKILFQRLACHVILPAVSVEINQLYAQVVYRLYKILNITMIPLMIV